MMTTQTRRLRLYTTESDYFGDRKVYEVICARARETKLAGATVVMALIGFGRTAHVHTRHLLDDDQSVVVEIVDEEIRLRDFVAALSDIPNIGLITLEVVEVIALETYAVSD
ncbi:MAG: DUF190 domain-containing protein [Pseudomonadota bacterium]